MFIIISQALHYKNKQIIYTHLSDDPTYEDSEKTALFAEYISQEQLDYDGPRSPIDEKIPAVEELKTVQPDWEKEEVKPKNGVVFRFQMMSSSKIKYIFVYSRYQYETCIEGLI